MKEVEENRMNKKAFSELGGTAACVLCGATSCGSFTPLDHESNDDDSDSPTVSKLFFGDSWFGSVTSLASLKKAGHHGVFIVKTANS